MFDRWGTVYEVFAGTKLPVSERRESPAERTNEVRMR